MLILTLSSYNDNDGELDVLEGIFSSMDALCRYVAEQGGDDDLSSFDPPAEPERKAGLVQTHVSRGCLDNGYGGRYYSVWAPEG